MSDDLQARCRAALLEVCRQSKWLKHPLVDVDDAAAACARAIYAAAPTIVHGGTGPWAEGDKHVTTWLHERAERIEAALAAAREGKKP